MKWCFKYSWFKLRLWYWKIMIEEYQFENTNLLPCSAENTKKVLTNRFRRKNEDDDSSEIEEIIQLIFPNGEIEEIPVTDNNLKYANLLKEDIQNKPRPKIK